MVEPEDFQTLMSACEEVFGEIDNRIKYNNERFLKMEWALEMISRLTGETLDAQQIRNLALFALEKEEVAVEQ